MKKFARYLVGAAVAVFLSTAYLSLPIVREVAANPSQYIEVCSNGIVYLPPDTKLVTCSGRIMRVIAVVPAGEQTLMREDCDCPRCCGGVCTVTVSCGGGGLCVAYLRCAM